MALQDLVNLILNTFQNANFWFFLASAGFAVSAGYKRAKLAFTKPKEDGAPPPPLLVISTEDEMRNQLEELLDTVLAENRRLRETIAGLQKTGGNSNVK